MAAATIRSARPPQVGAACHHAPGMDHLPDGRLYVMLNRKRNLADPASGKRRALVGRSPDAAAQRLAVRAFLAPPDCSRLVIRAFPWIRNAECRGIDLAHYPRLRRWHHARAARPVVQRSGSVLAGNQRLAAMTVRRAR